MNKDKLIDLVYNETGLKKEDIRTVVNSVIKNIIVGIENEGNVTMKDFGTFIKQKRKAKKGTNPRTHELITIDSYNTVVFKIGKGFRDKINGV